jgi:hypothetical protein
MKTSGLFAFMLLAGACAPAEPPARPTWDQDVRPILQGSCNHCHGETVGKMLMPLGRMDVCDPELFTAAQITVPLGAIVEAGLFEANILRPMAGTTRVSMPPPPASVLSTYERDVLVRWAKLLPGLNKVPGEVHPACEKQTRNRDPDMRLIGDPQLAGNDLRLVVEVWDPDQDQVMGKVTVGMTTATIPASGRREILIPGGQRGQPIEVVLVDGYTSKTFTFDN